LRRDQKKKRSITEGENKHKREKKNKRCTKGEKKIKSRQ
jgi:hypothetical protein